MSIFPNMPYTNMLVALQDRLGPEAVVLLRAGKGKQLILQSNNLSPAEKVIILNMFKGAL